MENIRSLYNPPRMCKLILDAVLLMKQMKIKKVAMITDSGVCYFDDSFRPFGKAMLANSDFLQSLRTYRVDKINDEMIELLAPYLEMYVPQSIHVR